MHKDKVQYEICFPDEEANEIFESLASLLKIDFDEQKLEEAINVEEYGNPKGLCIFRDRSDSNRFIMLDAANPGYIDRLIVRCDIEESKIVKRKIINLVNKLYKELGYDEKRYIQDLGDYFKSLDDGYKKALEKCELTDI